LNSLVLIKASGSHYDVGYTVGKNARTLIARSVDNYRSILPCAEGWGGPWNLPAGYLEAACESFPHFIEELQGMANGSGQSFSDLFFLNALEEALDLKPPAACTAIALSSSQGVWLGHNEDWYSADADSVIAIQARPKGKPAFISVTAAPFLAAVGMNEAGIAQGVNSLSSIDCRVGVPRMFVARAVLEASSFDEAITMAAPSNRAGGYNHLLADAGGKIGNFETSAFAENFIPAVSLAYHTNHYLSPQLKHLEKEASKHSLARYRRIGELEETLLKSQDNFGILVQLLRDHQNKPLSICRHAEEEKNGDGTIFSVIFEPAAFRAYVAVGNPCLGEYNALQFQ
jgi:isopenicillin-N N-acyltransferase like protein